MTDLSLQQVDPMMEHFTSEGGPHLLLDMDTIDPNDPNWSRGIDMSLTSANRPLVSNGRTYTPAAFTAIRLGGDIEGEITYLEFALQDPWQEISNFATEHWDSRRHLLFHMALCYSSRPDDRFREHRNLRLAQKPVWDRSQIRFAVAPKNLYGQTLTVVRFTPQVAPNMF